MIPKIRRDLQQIADMHVRGPGKSWCEYRTPRYRKDETCLIDEEISKEGKPSNREGDLREKIIYFDFEEFSRSRWEVSQEEIESRSR